MASSIREPSDSVTDKNNLIKNDLDRRTFLVNTLKVSGRITLATGFIYTISLVTNKNGNTAGAK